MADLANTDLTWLQSGEPVTGGSGGSSAGVLNRPLVELLANDTGLNTRINTLSDDDGYVKKVISSIKITETDAATTARVQIDATGLKAYDGTNIVLSANESGGVTLGYGTNDQISLAAGVLTGNFNAIILGNASGIGIDITEAAEYGLRLGNCTTGGYGPLHIINAGVAGASNLHSTYGNAEVDTFAVDSNHEMFIKTGVSTWTKVGATAASEGPVSSAAITSSLSTDNAVILDQDGLTMRKAAGAIRFDVNEDGSFTLGNSGGANLAFTTGDAMTLTSATLTSCSISGEQINSGTVAAARIADLSGTYAVVALGVTNGNSHDHSGGDGAQINHTTLSNIGSNSHSAIDSFISSHTHAFSDLTNGTAVAGREFSMTGHDSTPAWFKFQGSSYHTRIFCDTVGDDFYVQPSSSGNIDCFIGSSSYKFIDINLYASSNINATASGDGVVTLTGGADSSGNNYGAITINYSDGGTIVFNTRINTSTGSMTFAPTNFRPGGTQVVDLGLTGNRWDTVFCYDVDNLADYIWMDDRKKGKKTIPLNDLEILATIKPGKEIDPRTGCKFINDDTIPEILLSKHKETNAVLRDKEGKPGFSLRVLNSLYMGAFRQVKSMLENFDERLKTLEKLAQAN